QHHHGADAAEHQEVGEDDAGQVGKMDGHTLSLCMGGLEPPVQLCSTNKLDGRVKPGHGENWEYEDICANKRQYEWRCRSSVRSWPRRQREAPAAAPRTPPRSWVRTPRSVPGSGSRPA